MGEPAAEQACVPSVTGDGLHEPVRASADKHLLHGARRPSQISNILTSRQEPVGLATQNRPTRLWPT